MSFGDWLDERTGHRKALETIWGAPTKGGPSFAYVWGGATALCFIILAVTGLALMTAYQPSATTAWSSVHYIQTKLTAGWLIRGLHHNASHAIIILLIVHLVRSLVFGAYRKPREITWLSGLLMMGLLLAFVRTGYLLPWDQEGYWATYIPMNIIGTMPGGQFLKELALGGGSLGHLALTRFYALHVAVLPLLMIALLWGHAKQARRHGLTPRPGTKDDAASESYFPSQLALTMIAGLVVLAAIFVFTIKNHGVPLTAPADPSSDYPARPEWFFRAPFQALKYVPQSLEWLVLAGAPAIVGGYFAALPFLDKGKAGERPKIALLAPAAVIFLLVGGLTGISMSKDKADPAFAESVKTAKMRADRAITLAKEGVPPAGPLAMLALDPVTRGPELYDKHCGICHKLNDRGPKDDEQTAPDLTGFGTEKWIIAVLDHPDAPDMFGNTPFEGLMPSFTRPPEDPEEAEYFTKMKEEDQNAIAAWMAAESAGTAEKGKMKGEEIAKKRCTSCHRLDGEADDEDSLAPELRGWASVEWIRLQIENPGNGKTYPPGAMDPDLKGHMPAYEDDMSRAEIAMLAGWVYEQASGRSAKPEK